MKDREHAPRLRRCSQIHPVAPWTLASLTPPPAIVVKCDCCDRGPVILPAFRLGGLQQFHRRCARIRHTPDRPVSSSMPALF